MKIVSPLLLVAIFVAVTRAAAEPTQTEIPHVTAEVAELRTSAGVTRLAVRFINSGAKKAETDHYSVGKIVLVDAKSKQKHLALKDANGYFIGGPIGDSTLDGGRIYVVLEAGQRGVAWAYFNALPTGTVVSVEVPQMFPFEDVVVTEGPGTLLSAGSAMSTPAGAVATLASVQRADQALKVRLKLAAEPGVTVDLRSPYFEYKDVYLFDPAGKRKYPLIKDTEGFFQAQPLTVKLGGGRIIPDWNKPILMSLAFQAPPDDVKTVDLILPDFQPFEGIVIEGQGGASAGGIAAAGKSLGLDGVLKELQAEVTAQEIKIDLSADVLFDFDKADLKPTAEVQLNNLLTVVNSRPDANVAIEGHTDLRGDAAYNQTLSQRRAESVSAWLSEHGVPAGRINATGAGETRPINPGDTDTDHQMNRRVEIRIQQRASATTGEAAGCIGADPKVGIAACTRLIEQSAPGSVELVSAYATRAKHYVTTNDLKSALADANEALRQDPLHADALHNRAITYIYLGQYDEALADINKEVDIAPEDPEAYATRARIYAESGQPDAAMTDLNKALAIDPRHVDALNSRGAIHTMSGQMDVALADFNAVLAIDPKNADAYSSRGGMYLMTNRLPQALADLDQAIRLNPTDVNALLNRGVTYVLEKRFDQAIADFTHALALEPGNAHLHFQRATAYFMSGRASEALADADLTIRSQSDHLPAHQLRAAALEALKRSADALDAHRRVLKLDPTNQQSLEAVQRLLSGS